jgi:hypothetical protein
MPSHALQRMQVQVKSEKGVEMGDAVDLSAVKEAQQKTWSEGDFAMVAGLIMIVAEGLAEAL